MKIAIKDIYKSYGKKEVLKGIDLSIESGKCIGILGANGCGKSTLFSILAGVQKAKRGEFLYDGKNLFDYPSRRSHLVGYVPQSPALFEELTARDNLLLWYKKDELQKELSSGVLNMLGINEMLKIPVCKMSGGMKKRLSIGCSVSKKPAVLLLDEPMSALDIACKEKIAEYIRTYKNAGGTVLIATHDVMELELCDEYYIIKNGKLLPFDYDGNLSRLVKAL